MLGESVALKRKAKIAILSARAYLCVRTDILPTTQYSLTARDVHTMDDC